MIDAGRIPLALYVHLPWCVRKCPYCDFNSHEWKGERFPETEYLDALRAASRAELASFHESIRRFRNPHVDPVGLEPELDALRTRMIREARGLST